MLPAVLVVATSALIQIREHVADAIKLRSVEHEGVVRGRRCDAGMAELVLHHDHRHTPAQRDTATCLTQTVKCDEQPVLVID